MVNPSTHLFSLENGAGDLSAAFDDVVCVRPRDTATLTFDDAEIAAGYTLSGADHYEHEIAAPWSEVVAEVRVHDHGGHRGVRVSMSSSG